MQNFEIVVSVFEDGDEDVTHMFGQASGLGGMMECFSSVVNSVVGATCRVELRYIGRVVLAFECHADAMSKVVDAESPGGGRDGQQN